MTNREHILKLLAGVADEVLLDFYEDLPPEVLSQKPIYTACDSCPQRNNEDCIADIAGISRCADHISAWMAAEVQFR